MVDLRFEWDDKKDKANQKKHGASFDEAISVFYDENAIEFMISTILTRKSVSCCWG